MQQKNSSKKIYYFKDIILSLLPALLLFILLIFIFFFRQLTGQDTGVWSRISTYLLSIILFFYTPIYLAVQYARRYREEQSDKLTGLNTEQEIYIKAPWDWIAFFGAFIWALGNRLYGWALLSIIPLVGLFPWIVLTLVGRCMSWERGGWKSFDQFYQRQRVLKIIISIIILLVVVMQIVAISKLLSIRSSSKENNQIHIFQPTDKEIITHPLLDQHFPSVRFEKVTDEDGPIQGFKYKVQALHQGSYYFMPSFFNRLLSDVGSSITRDNAEALARAYILLDEIENITNISFNESKLSIVDNTNADGIVQLLTSIPQEEKMITWLFQFKDGQFLYILRYDPNTGYTRNIRPWPREGYDTSGIQNILKGDKQEQNSDIISLPAVGECKEEYQGTCRTLCLSDEQSVNYPQLYQDCKELSCCAPTAVIQQLLDEQNERFEF